MSKSIDGHEPHLTVRAFNVPPGGEWVPRSAGWTLIQVQDGTGYCLQPGSNQELETGAALVIADGTPVTLRASHLGRLLLTAFNVVPRRLGGLLTLSEQDRLQEATAGACAFQRLTPDHPVAAAMKDLRADANPVGLRSRLQLLQIFADCFGHEWETPAAGDPADARERLRAFLQETPASELLEMSSNELAQRAHCTSRHLSRIFRELVGVSFQDKRTELRLTRARELLASSDSKIVDVALESGYRSLSLFNSSFARRFGTTPGKWREKQGVRRQKQKRSLVTLR